MFGGDLSVMCPARNKRGGDSFEVVVEWFVVEEDPIIVVVPVETVLHLSD